VPVLGVSNIYCAEESVLLGEEMTSQYCTQWLGMPHLPIVIYCMEDDFRTYEAG